MAQPPSAAHRVPVQMGSQAFSCLQDSREGRMELAALDCRLHDTVPPSGPCRQYGQKTQQAVQRDGCHHGTEMLAPEIQVYAPSHPVQGTEIANVETVVVLPCKRKDSSQAIHLTRIPPSLHRRVLGRFHPPRVARHRRLRIMKANSKARVLRRYWRPRSQSGLGLLRTNSTSS